jgi:hypothetical protein
VRLGLEFASFPPHPIPLPEESTCLAMVGMARCAVPASVVAGGMKYSSDTAIRKSCAAARGADIAARCPYQAKRIPRRGRALLCLRVLRSLGCDAAKLLDGLVKGSARLSALGLCDRSLTRPPELLDGFDAPERAGPRRADGLAAN